jgi:hypothetical protein
MRGDVDLGPCPAADELWKQVFRPLGGIRHEVVHRDLPDERPRIRKRLYDVEHVDARIMDRGNV